MVEIKNVKVYDLRESIMACRNAMRLKPVERYSADLFEDEETAQPIREDFEKSLERAIKLAKAPSNSGHANFLTGIRVSFDITYPNYISPEMQRYHWFDIVTSSSKMHTLTKMAGDPTRYNKYVTQETLDQMKKLQDEYNALVEKQKTMPIRISEGKLGESESSEDLSNRIYEAFMKLVSNCPQGIELFMRVSTNYMQLRNIYAQRKHHKLKEDWGAVCRMIESLPYAEEFLLGSQE